MPKYPTITVKVPPHPDRTLAGRARCRKPWAKNRMFTETPESVELRPEVASAIHRLINQGCLVEVAPDATPMVALPLTHEESRR